MIENIAELFKSLWIPGSATFFIFGLLLAAVLFMNGRRSALWGRRWLISISLLGYLLSTPLVASSLLRAISIGYSPLEVKAQSIDIDAIVILGGGGATYDWGAHEINVLSEQSSLRLLEGLRLYHELSPEYVVVSGGTSDRAGLTTPEGETMASILIEFGIPEERILIESASGNTRDQATDIPNLLDQHGVDRFVLVTSPAHMRRADLSFKAVNSQHLTSIAPAMSETKPEMGWSPWPNSQALDMSTTIFREVVGLVYYLLRGWI